MSNNVLFQPTYDQVPTEVNFQNFSYDQSMQQQYQYQEPQNYMNTTMDTGVTFQSIKAAFSTGDYENEPPLLEELGINFSHIFQKAVTVLNPLKSVDANILEDADLAGPLVFCFMFGSFLLLAGKAHFEYIYGVALMGWGSMYAILNLMSETGIDAARTASVLGYSLLPMVILSSLSAFLHLTDYIGLAISSVSIVWCANSASVMFSAYLNAADQRFLIAYPVGLLYGAFALLALREDRGPYQHQAQQVEFELGLKLIGQIGELENYYAFYSPKASLVPRSVQELEHENIEWIEEQIPKKRLFKRDVIDVENIKKRLGIEDPDFGRQWHLLNVIEPHHDLNLTGVWEQGVNGSGSTVSFMDDGLDYEHPDLAENFDALGSYDFNDHVPLPTPRLYDDKHGTRCAGEVGALKNKVGGIGVAFAAKLAGIRILSGTLTNEDEARAVNYGFQTSQIYSCSWGPRDDGRTMDAFPSLVDAAIKKGIKEGRGGLGSIFVFAAGNGAIYDDNCNFDGYTNSIYTVTVAAINRNHVHSVYSEQCSAVLITMYSGIGGGSIYTTDWDLPNEHTYTDSHGGTSAAAPLASGLYALLLQVRDIQHISMRSCVIVDPESGDWRNASNGRKYSHKYGYGVMDGYRLIENAKTYLNVGPQTSIATTYQNVYQDIPDGNPVGIAHEFLVTEQMVKDSNSTLLEHITVTVDIEHQYRGDISISLLSPNGLVSDLIVGRKADSDPNGFKRWTMMSVAHWDENPIGKWTLHVFDKTPNGKKGRFKGFNVIFYSHQPSNVTVPRYILPSTGKPIEVSTPDKPIQVPTPETPLPSTPDKDLPLKPIPGGERLEDNQSLSGIIVFLTIISITSVIVLALYVCNKFGYFKRFNRYFALKDEHEFQELDTFDDHELDEIVFEGRQL